MYKGSHNGSSVCVKRVRVSARDGPQKAAKACYWCHCFPCSLWLTKPADLLPRSHTVETFDTPQHPPTTWYHDLSLPAHFRLDVRWEPAGVSREKPRCGPAWACMCPSCCLSNACSRHQLSDTAEGLCYLHSCNIIHGDLKGVCGRSNSCFTTVLTLNQPNILVDNTGRARIADFGLATVARNLDSISAPPFSMDSLRGGPHRKS